MACALTAPIWKASASAVNGKAAGIAVEEVPLRKYNWSRLWPVKLEVRRRRACFLRHGPQREIQGNIV
jgi:hypothetical protein